MRLEKKLARLQARYGFTIFHAKDFKPSASGVRSGEFSYWTDDKCDQLIADLTQLVRSTLTQGITISLSHGRYMNEYRAPPIPKKMNLDSQYGACFRACLGQLLILMSERGNRDRMNVVFEGGHRNVKDCERIFNDVKRQWTRRGIDVLDTFSVGNKSDCMPLMLGDFLAAGRSLLKSRTEDGTINIVDYILPSVTGNRSAPKGSIAILELAPDALKNLKVGYELNRQKAAEQWRARKSAKRA